MNYLIKIWMAVLVLMVSACAKDTLPDPVVPIMPPLTHQGLNTFGCYLNFTTVGATSDQGRELFVANYGDNYWDLPALSGSFNEGTRRLGFQAIRYLHDENGEETGESDDIVLRSYILDGTGTYDYVYHLEDGSDGYRNYFGERCDYYFQSVPDFDLGKVTITHLDEEKNIIAGTFYMNLINGDCETGDTILRITDGRFDFRY